MTGVVNTTGALADGVAGWIGVVEYQSILWQSNRILPKEIEMIVCACDSCVGGGKSVWVECTGVTQAGATLHLHVYSTLALADAGISLMS